MIKYDMSTQSMLTSYLRLSKVFFLILEQLVVLKFLNIKMLNKNQISEIVKTPLLSYGSSKFKIVNPLNFKLTFSCE